MSKLVKDRKKLSKAPKNGKIKSVMGEFKRGALKTSAVKKVKNMAQATAIAISEARAAQKKRRDKRGK